jgi:hypothetical protein
MRHGHSNFSHVSDLVAVWQAVEKAVRMRPTRKEQLFALHASKERVEKLEQSLSELGGSSRHYTRQYADPQDSTPNTPGGFVAQNAVLDVAASLLEIDFSAF